MACSVPYLRLCALAGASNVAGRDQLMTTLFAICATYEVDDGQAKGFMLMRKEPDGGSKPWPILITRKGNNFFGFETPVRIRACGSTPGPASSWTRTAISSPAATITPSSTWTQGIASLVPVRVKR